MEVCSCCNRKPVQRFTPRCSAIQSAFGAWDVFLIGRKGRCQESGKVSLQFSHFLDEEPLGKLNAFNQFESRY